MAMHSLRVRRMSWMQICGHAHAIRSESGERARLTCWFRRHAETIFREARNFRVVLNGSGSPRLRDAIANTRDARAPQPAWQHFITKSLAHASLEKSSPVFAIEFGDETGTNFCRANRFALVGIGAIAKTFRVHLAHHFQ